MGTKCDKSECDFYYICNNMMKTPLCANEDEKVSHIKNLKK